MMLSSESTEWRLAKKALLDSVIFHPELLTQNLFSHAVKLCVDLFRGLFIAGHSTRYSEISRGHLLWFWIMREGIVAY